LFKINYINNIIKIFTINKYDKQNDILIVNIDLLNKNAFIEKCNYYKKYNKFNILEIGLKIIDIYKLSNLINNSIINNNFFNNNHTNNLNNLNNFYKFNIIVYKNIINSIKIIIFLYEYNEYHKNYKKISNFYAYKNNEIFINKLKRLIKFKITIIYSLINNDTFIIYLYNVIIKDYIFYPEKYILSFFEYSLEARNLINNQLYKEINYYKQNKNIYLNKFHSKIENNIKIGFQIFDTKENIHIKLINNNIYNINIIEFKNYLEEGYFFILNNKDDIIKLWFINNFDKWFIFLYKKFLNIKFINNIFKDIFLYIELLIIINIFYKFKKINIKYDFINDIDEIKNIILMSNNDNILK
jgi:hypothetical protein